MKNKLLYFAIFQSLFVYINSENYCKFGSSCLNNCIICGINNNYSNCNYYNLFCETNSGIKYYEEYKINYIKYFSTINELKNICGQNYIKINSNKKKQNIEILKINENKEDFLKVQNLHCYYSFQNEYYKDKDKKLSLIIEHKGNRNNNNENNVKFSIIILLYSQSNSANIFELSQQYLNNDKETIELKYYTSFIIYIDVDSIENINESIIISLDYKDNKKFSPIYILLIILAGLILIILIILVISIIKSKFKGNQRRRVAETRESVNRAELEKNEKIKKIKQLFETDFVPIYYSKELDDKEFNGCTICLKKYRDNISKIIILQCNHLFHYKCLYDWLINNKHWKCPICNLDLTEKVKLVSRSNKNSEDQINIQKLNINHGIATQTSNDLISLNINTNN